MTLHKGDIVSYPMWLAKRTIRARVERAHRNGEVTIRALFELKDGEDVGSYIGYRYRVPTDCLSRLKFES